MIAKQSPSQHRCAWLTAPFAQGGSFYVLFILCPGRFCLRTSSRPFSGNADILSIGLFCESQYPPLFSYAPTDCAYIPAAIAFSVLPSLEEIVQLRHKTVWSDWAPLNVPVRVPLHNQ